MEAPEFIKNIDWELLKKQKNDMIIVMSILDSGSELEQSLEGILSLIDAAQDFAVDVMKIDENVVFDLDKEGE